MWTWFYKLASPPYVYGVAAALTPWLLGAAAITIGYGLIGGLVFAPPDYQQGDAFRIVYVHVPSAWMSLFIYTTMAFAGAIALIWRIKMGHAVAAASAVRMYQPRRRLIAASRSGAGRSAAARSEE